MRQQDVTRLIGLCERMSYNQAIPQESRDWWKTRVDYWRRYEPDDEWREKVRRRMQR